MSTHGDRRGGLVYHWRHGWIPLDHFAALSKAKGSHKGAEKVMAKHGITPPHKGPAVAKRGDVVVVTRKTSSFTSGPGGGYKAGEEHHVGVATSVTRDGKVKTADVVWGSGRSKLTIDHRQHTVHVVGGPDKIDVQGALGAAAANPWPHAPEHKGKAFDSLDQVRAALAPHRKSGSGTGAAKMSRNHPEPAPGYRVEQNHHPQVGPLSSYKVIGPNGHVTHVAEGSRQKAINASHKHAQMESVREAERQKILAAHRAVEAKRAAFDAQLAKPLKVDHANMADYRAAQHLRDKNRYQRVNGGKTQLSGEELTKILADPDASAADKKLAQADLADVGYTEAKSRLASVSDANLAEARSRIRASDWPQWRKDGAERVISERLGGSAGKAPTVGAKVHIGTDVRYHGQGTVTSVDHATKTAIVNMNGRSGRVAFDQVHGSKLEAQAKVKSTFGSGSLADMGGNKAAKKLARQEPAVGVPLPKGYKLTGGGSAGYTLHHPDGTSQHAGNSQLGAAKLARQHLSGGGTSRRTPLDPALVKDLRGGSADKHLVTDGTGTHFTAERAALHDKIVNDIVGGAEKGHDKPSFVMLGGGPASGKTKAAQQAAHDFPGAVTINPDDIKAMLPEYAKMGEKAASFTHEESSYLAKRANAAAMAQRSHIILDAVGDTSVKSVEGKVAQARAHGYATHARYVTVPTETAQARALLRGQRSGRFVPPAVIDHAHAGVSDVFPKVVGRFDTATLHDNTDQWTHVMSAAGGQTTVHAPALYQAFLHKAGGDF